MVWCGRRGYLLLGTALAGSEKLVVRDRGAGGFDCLASGLQSRVLDCGEGRTGCTLARARHNGRYVPVARLGELPHGKAAAWMGDLGALGSRRLRIDKRTRGDALHSTRMLILGFSYLVWLWRLLPVFLTMSWHSRDSDAD